MCPQERNGIPAAEPTIYDHPLAEELHDLLCRESHTGSCDLYLRSAYDTNGARKRHIQEYLEMASKLTERCPQKNLMEILQTMAAHRP